MAIEWVNGILYAPIKEHKHMAKAKTYHPDLLQVHTQLRVDLEEIVRSFAGEYSAHLHGYVRATMEHCAAAKYPETCGWYLMVKGLHTYLQTTP